MVVSGLSKLKQVMLDRRDMPHYCVGLCGCMPSTGSVAVSVDVDVDNDKLQLNLFLYVHVYSSVQGKPEFIMSASFLRQPARVTQTNGWERNRCQSSDPLVCRASL